MNKIDQKRSSSFLVYKLHWIFCERSILDQLQLPVFTVCVLWFWSLSPWILIDISGNIVSNVFVLSLQGCVYFRPIHWDFDPKKTSLLLRGCYEILTACVHILWVYATKARDIQFSQNRLKRSKLFEER